METTKKQLDILEAEKLAADKAFFEYRKAYNKEHQVEAGTMIREIIALHKKGLKNKEIVAKGYNKNTVNRQVNLFVKNKKVEKTIVRQYFGKTK